MLIVSLMETSTTLGYTIIRMKTAVGTETPVRMEMSTQMIKTNELQLWLLLIAATIFSGLAHNLF